MNELLIDHYVEVTAIVPPLGAKRFAASVKSNVKTDFVFQEWWGETHAEAEAKAEAQWAEFISSARRGEIQPTSL
jgi:hypothetical protein